MELSDELYDRIEELSETGNEAMESEDYAKAISCFQEALDCPNNYYICLSDNAPENPVVWSTDHEEFFTEVTNEGRLKDFLDRFMTKEEFLELVKSKLEE